MEAIKISVEVSVNLSESTQQFIASIFSKSISAPQPAPAKPVISAPQPAPAKPVISAPQPAPAKPVISAPQPAPVSTSVTIEDVRKMLAQKVNEHRDTIKQKLNEFGAPSVTKLDPAKYNEMYNFLNSL